VNRRNFVRNLVYSAGGILIGEELLSTRTIFLPPCHDEMFIAYDTTSFEDYTVWIKLKLVDAFGLPYYILQERRYDDRHRRGSLETLVSAVSKADCNAGHEGTNDPLHRQPLYALD
jgi:hypothetical protein